MGVSRRCSERGPADSPRDKFNAFGGWLPSLTFAFACMSAMGDLASYLMGRLPAGMSYPDAAQLCMRLYCTADGVPEELCPLDKERLGESFAKLTRLGWVRQEKMWYASLFGATFHQVTDKGHWIEVIASITKKRDVHKLELGESLAQQIGFVRSERPS